MQAIKDKLNALTEDQVKAQAKLNEWREAIALLESADDFNGKLEAIKAQPEAVRALFKAAAKDKGLHWAGDGYSDKEAA
jgi:hypothetical protein